MVSVLLTALLLPSPQAPQLPPGHPAVTGSSYVPQRVFDTRQKTFSDFESMLADLARADAVFVGEQHDDPNTHRLELAIVEGLTRRGVSVVVALEMFERDVQSQVEGYAAGRITEEQFLKDSRPWPRYASDYRPLIEFAKAHHLPIVASNVPRRIASDVSKNGMPAIEKLGSDDRAFAAREVLCPTSGDYYQRFGEAMGGHEGANPNFYFAQCVKDETMGESVARRSRRTPRAASPSSTSTARSTAISAKAPPTAPAAACPAAASPSSRCSRLTISTPPSRTTTTSSAPTTWSSPLESEW